MIDTAFIENCKELTDYNKRVLSRTFREEVKRQAKAILNSGSLWDEDYLSINHAKAILLIVCMNLKLNVLDIKGKSRKRPLADARKIYSFIIRNAAKPILLSEAGDLINRTHSAIINQSREAEILNRVNKEFSAKLNKCLKAYNDRNKEITK